MKLIKLFKCWPILDWGSCQSWHEHPSPNLLPALKTPTRTGSKQLNNFLKNFITLRLCSIIMQKDVTIYYLLFLE